VRVTTAFNRLLCLPGTSVTGVSFTAAVVTVSVRLRGRRLVCPRCGFSTRFRHDTRPVDSSWRGLDLGRWRLRITARLRRLACPRHGVVVEAVPFARGGARFTRDVEDLIAWLATSMDKSAIARLCRVDWDTVGRIIERVVGDKLDPHRLDQLFVIGIDDVSWRKGHQYLTLVSDHANKTIVWGAEGRDAATVEGLFDQLGPERSEALQAVSMDMAPAYAKTVRARSPKAIICFDPFHVVQLATKALDQVRREH
jgi:transposase